MYAQGKRHIDIWESDNSQRSNGPQNITFKTLFKYHVKMDDKEEKMLHP